MLERNVSLVERLSGFLLIMLELPYLEIYAEIFDRRFKNRVLQKVDIPRENA